MNTATKLVIVLVGLVLLADFGHSETNVLRTIVKRHAQMQGPPGGMKGPGQGGPVGSGGPGLQGGPPGGMGGSAGAGATMGTSMGASVGGGV